MLLYRELVPWYRLVDPYEEHLDEATCYREGFERGVRGSLETLLDLGAGAGGNAFHLKQRLRCTLADLSEDMLALSRELNPECEHVLGDMRTIRLGRTFDAVLVHDAVMYMTTEADLRAAIETASVHTRPGGAAIFAPDIFRDTFVEKTDDFETDRGARAMRGVEWMWDPDPTDSTYTVDYAFLFRDREQNTVHAVHDRHVEGMFSREKWSELLRGAGFEAELIARPLDEEGAFDQIFLCRKPI